MRLLLGLACAFTLFAQSPNSHSVRLSGSTIPRNAFGFAYVNGRVVEPTTIPEHAEIDVWVEQIPKQYMESISSGFVNQPDDFDDTPFERFIRDHFHKVYIRYAIKIERTSEPYKYRLTFSPAQSPPPSDIAKDPEWKIVDPPLPAPQIVGNTEPLSIELFSNPPSTRRVVDVIRVGVGLFRTRTEGGRDVYADDAEMTLLNPKLKVNGIPANLPSAAKLQGKSIQLSIPAHGTYTLALRPLTPEMKRAGEIEGQRLTLQIGGDIFRLDCDDSVATGSGIYNVYAQALR
jgi:hypothetical protein